MNILIVDDDTTLAQALDRALKRWGHFVDTVGTGHDAAGIIQDRQYDLILLDIFLPDGKGYEWIPMFKHQEPGRYIITMTGYNTPEMEKKVRSYGIAYYMAKPVSKNELKLIIDHLSNKQIHKEASHEQPEPKARPAAGR
ncbi:MAG: response regulator [Thermodesulfobacteriota bacterium]|nr:response regulator [Thermodesulfobacteriota bacterium]